MEELSGLRIVDDLARAAAEDFLRTVDESIAARGRFTVALSGGSTPRALYRLLASGDEPYHRLIPWDSVHFFWGDERHVPPDHPDSNYRMAREALLDHVPVPAVNVHRIRGEAPDAAVAAAAYEEELRGFFQPAPGEAPRFDLVLLGLGPEGHTASLFPGSPALHETGRWVAAPWVEAHHTFRVTLTPPVLNAAARVVFLVSGADKAAALRAVIDFEGDSEGERDVDRYPAQVVRPAAGTLLWLVDRAAAGSLSRAAG